MKQRIFLGLFAAVIVVFAALAATYPNKFVSNSDPEAIGWTNTATAGITATVKLVGGSTNAASQSTNMNTAIINPVDGTGMIGGRLGSGFIWSSIGAGPIWAYTPSGFVIYTNAVFGAGMLGNANTLTNISGLGFSSGTASLSNTNLNLLIGNIYQTLVLGTNCNITNVSGIGSASLKLLPGGGDRTISFPTNWAWLGQTNGLAPVAGLYSITLTNGLSRIGWLSVVASGTDPTNVTAAYQQSP